MLQLFRRNPLSTSDAQLFAGPNRREHLERRPDAGPTCYSALRRTLAIWIYASALAAAFPAYGQFEIDQTCAIDTGCFPGDDPGYPVTITEPGTYTLTGDLYNDGEYVYTIEGNPLADIDMAGFNILGPGFSNGIRTARSVRSGRLEQVFVGIVNVAIVEDVRVGALGAGVQLSSGVLELRRSVINADQNVAVACEVCELEDVAAHAPWAHDAVRAGSGTFRNVSTSIDGIFQVSGAATIVDSSIGGFELGDGSSMTNTTSTCLKSPVMPHSSAGDDFQFIDSTFAYYSLNERCRPTYGDRATFEGSSFGYLRAGSEAVLRGNNVAFNFEVGVTVGSNSIVENNILDGAVAPTGSTALHAGNSSRIASNTIRNTPDGIVCDQACAVAGNDISNYSGSGLTLGANSYHFGNEIDETGAETVVGGINLDPDNLGSPTPTTTLNSDASVDSGSDIFPDLATDGIGNWVAIWQSTNDLSGTIGNDRDLLVIRSADDAQTWTDPIALNKTAQSDTVDDVESIIAADSSGNWVAAWSSPNSLTGTAGSDRDILFSRSADAGATWTDVGALNANAATDSGSDERPAIATDGGVFVAVWQSDGGTSGPDFDIWTARSFTGGASWTTPTLLNAGSQTDSAHDVHPAIATDRVGNWIAVWESSDSALGGNRSILVARSADDGATWTMPEPLDPNPAIDSDVDTWPTLATDGAGNWLVAWESDTDLAGTVGDDRDILFSRSTDNGTNWSPADPLNTNANNDSGDDANPRLMGDARRGWTAIWNSNESFGETVGGDFDILVARSADHGITWSSPRVLNTNAADDLGGDYNPNFSINADGERAIAVWHSDDELSGSVGADWDIFVTAIDRCPMTGALPPSTAALASNQSNWCENWSGVSQPGDNLESAQLDRADLTFTDLSGAILTNASLTGANLTGADLASATLTGAVYDEATLFPSGDSYLVSPWGFDGADSPWDRGMIPVPEPSSRLYLLLGALASLALARARKQSDLA